MQRPDRPLSKKKFDVCGGLKFDLLKRRIEEASKYVPLERLCNYLGNPVTIDDEKRKLELVVKIAKPSGPMCTKFDTPISMRDTIGGR